MSKRIFSFKDCGGVGDCGAINGDLAEHERLDQVAARFTSYSEYIGLEFMAN